MHTGQKTQADEFPTLQNAERKSNPLSPLRNNSNKNDDDGHNNKFTSEIVAAQKLVWTQIAEEADLGGINNTGVYTWAKWKQTTRKHYGQTRY